MKVVIIGGAASGMTIASRIRKLSKETEVIVLQKEKYVSLGACGLPYFVANEDVSEDELLVRTIDEFAEQNITIHPESTVIKIDPETKKVIYLNNNKENELAYDKLVIATGAMPIVPSFINVNNKNIFTLTRLEDAVSLKEKLNDKSIKKVAIIGSGFIGLEAVEMVLKYNKTVILVEKSVELSSKVFDTEISSLLEQELLNNNVVIYKDCALNGIKENNNSLILGFENKEDIEVDLAILAVGFKPATDFLSNSGIKMLANGAVIVDRHGRTNIENIYACGDCATSFNKLTKENSYTPLATIARKFAKVVADDILDIESEFAGHIQSSIVKSFAAEMASCGLNEKVAKDLGYEVKTVFIKDKDHPSYYPNPTLLALKLVINRKTNTLLGAQMYGSNLSVLRINFLISLIWNQIELNKSLSQIDLVYSPPFSRVVDIFHIALEKYLKESNE